jgi:hypothetical protein
MYVWTPYVPGKVSGAGKWIGAVVVECGVAVWLLASVLAVPGSIPANPQWVGPANEIRGTLSLPVLVPKLGNRRCPWGTQRGVRALPVTSPVRGLATPVPTQINLFFTSELSKLLGDAIGVEGNLYGVVQVAAAAELESPPPAAKRSRARRSPGGK